MRSKRLLALTEIFAPQTTTRIHQTEARTPDELRRLLAPERPIHNVDERRRLPAPERSSYNVYMEEARDFDELRRLLHPPRLPAWKPIPTNPIPKPKVQLSSPTRELYPAIRRALRGSGPAEALDIFQRHHNAIASESRNALLDKAILLFFSHRRDKEGIEAFNMVQPTDYRPSQQVYTRLIQADYGQLGDGAINVLGNVLEGDKGPLSLDDKAVAALLEYIGRRGHFDALDSLFEKYRRRVKKDHGVEPGPDVYRAMIRSSGSRGDLARARKWFALWRDNTVISDTGPPPDPGPYLALLKCESRSSSRSPRHHLPIIELMAQDKVPLTTDVFNALIAHELRRGDIGGAFSLYSRMPSPLSSKDEHARPDRRTFHLMLRACRNRYSRSWAGRTGSAFTRLAGPERPDADMDIVTLVHHMIESRVRLSTDLINACLTGLVESREFGAAYCVIQIMRILRIEPDAETHATVVNGIAELWVRRLVPDDVASSDGQQPVSGHRHHGVGGRLIADFMMRVSSLRNLADDELATTWDFGREDLDHREERTPDRVRKRRRIEYRDFGYLELLLRRCVVGDEEEWKRQVREAWDRMRRTRGWPTREIARLKTRPWPRHREGGRTSEEENGRSDEGGGKGAEPASVDVQFGS
jgi:hypothetical protein